MMSTYKQTDWTREAAYAQPIMKEVKELKHKKGIPTVIEYQGRRYVLDVKNTIKR